MSVRFVCRASPSPHLLVDGYVLRVKLDPSGLECSAEMLRCEDHLAEWCEARDVRKLVGHLRDIGARQELLLDALRNLLRETDSITVGCPDIQRAREAARDAIAKAEGGTDDQ